MTFQEFLQSKSNENIDEAFKTDADGIKQVQKKHTELKKKIRAMNTEIAKAEAKCSDVFWKFSEMSATLTQDNANDKELQKQLKEYGSEVEHWNGVLSDLYIKVEPLKDELQRLTTLIVKMAQRNAKEAGLDIFDYVSKNKLEFKKI